MQLLAPAPMPVAARRLFCLPAAGQGASRFLAWGQALPGTEVVAVRSPGRESRLLERPHARFQDLVHEIAEGITPFLASPWGLFGHSFGALVAFELARELRRRGLSSPRLLVVAAAEAPQLRRSSPPPGREDLVRQLQDRATVLGYEPLSEEQLELMLPPLEADLGLAGGYAYAAEEPLDCRLVALGGSLDPEVNTASLEAWRIQGRGAFSLELFPGGHFFLESARAQVLVTLADLLESEMSTGA